MHLFFQGKITAKEANLLNVGLLASTMPTYHVTRMCTTLKGGVWKFKPEKSKWKLIFCQVTQIHATGGISDDWHLCSSILIMVSSTFIFYSAVKQGVDRGHLHPCLTLPIVEVLPVS